MDWFTADLHFRHNNIVKHSLRKLFMSEQERSVVESGDRGEIERLRISRETTDRMNDGQTDEINRVVQPSDRLWIIGDFAYPKRDANPQEVCKVYRFYRDRFNCRSVILIWGNHDPKVDSRARELIKTVFSQTYDKLTVRVEGQKIHMNHEPMAIWDGRHHGVWHLYGHTHSNGEPWLEQVMPGRFAMDVGVDNAYKLLGAYRPFSFQEIADIMRNKAGFGLLKSREYHHRS